MYNEVFSNDEMGRITEIINDTALSFDSSALEDFIKILNDYEDSEGQKSFSEMSDEELLAQFQKLKENKR